MAVNHKQGDVEIVNWYRLAFWGKVGETAMKYLKKGKQHMVSGQQVVREFVKADGTPGYGVQVSVDRLVLLGGGDGNGQASLAPVAAPQGSGAAVADADLPF
jgi:single-strand DNA-binding protein